MGDALNSGPIKPRTLRFSAQFSPKCYGVSHIGFFSDGFTKLRTVQA